MTYDVVIHRNNVYERKLISLISGLHANVDWQRSSLTIVVFIFVSYMALMQENLSLGFLTYRVCDQPAQLQRQAIYKVPTSSGNH